MCGIAGIIGRPTRQEIVKILLELQERGTDATGVGLNCKGQYKVLKTGVDATTICDIDVFRRSITHYCKTANIALLHTRLATHGSAVNNNNNHPIHNKAGVIIHNGMVSIDEFHKTVGQTDTEELLESITKHGMEEAIKQASGSFAIAYMNYTDRHTVYLYNHISPLVLGRKHGNIYFCSTAEILKRAIGKYKHYQVQEHHLYKIDARTMTIEDCGTIEPKPSTIYYYCYGGGQRGWLDDYCTPYSGYGDTYKERQGLNPLPEPNKKQSKQGVRTVFRPRGGDSELYWLPDPNSKTCKECQDLYQEETGEFMDTECPDCPFSIPHTELLSEPIEKQVESYEDYKRNYRQRKWAENEDYEEVWQC